MKTIGVLGGLGPQATMDFESHIHTVSQKLIPQFENQGYPPMIVQYLRHAPMIFKQGVPVVPLKPDPRLLEGVRKLSNISDILVIPSNTPYFFISEIEKAFSGKVLNMIQITIDQVKNKKVKKVGILAIGHTLKSGLYQKPLENLGISYEVITDEIANKLDKAIFGIMEGKDREESYKIMNEALTYLRNKKVDCIILGCSELPLLLKEQSQDPDLIDPTKLLAEAAVRYAFT